MPYLLCRLGKLCAIRWTGAPELSDVDRVVADVRATREAPGRGVLLLSVVPMEGLHMPAADVRERMQQRLPDLIESIESIDVVLEGSSTKVALVRTFLRGMSLISRLKFEHRFHTSADEALARLEPKLSLDRSRILAALRTGKIL